jgi:hypothetical protein
MDQQDFLNEGCDLVDSVVRYSLQNRVWGEFIEPISVPLRSPDLSVDKVKVVWLERGLAEHG